MSLICHQNPSEYQSICKRNSSSFSHIMFYTWSIFEIALMKLFRAVPKLLLMEFGTHHGLRSFSFNQSWQVLSCLLATQFVDSKPQWQYWHQPLYHHYTQYTLPFYSQNYLTEAAGKHNHLILKFIKKRIEINCKS